MNSMNIVKEMIIVVADSTIMTTITVMKIIIMMVMTGESYQRKFQDKQHYEYFVFLNYIQQKTRVNDA